MLPIITKEGYLQMVLIYIKPMVSLHIGLNFAGFVKILDKYPLADDSTDYVKTSRLCLAVTDTDGYIYGINSNCCTYLGLPTTEATKTL